MDLRHTERNPSTPVYKSEWCEDDGSGHDTLRNLTTFVFKQGGGDKVVLRGGLGDCSLSLTLAQNGKNKLNDQEDL